MGSTVLLYALLGGRMAIETMYTQARANLKALLDEVAENREQVIIHRRGGDNVALIAADELRGLVETAHLLRSPRNAQRLIQALRRAQAGKGASGTARQATRRARAGQRRVAWLSNEIGWLFSSPRFASICAIGGDRSPSCAASTGDCRSGASGSIRGHRQAGTFEYLASGTWSRRLTRQLSRTR